MHTEHPTQPLIKTSQVTHVTTFPNSKGVLIFFLNHGCDFITKYYFLQSRELDVALSGFHGHKQFIYGSNYQLTLKTTFFSDSKATERIPETQLLSEILINFINTSFCLGLGSSPSDRINSSPSPQNTPGLSVATGVIVGVVVAVVATVIVIAAIAYVSRRYRNRK